MRDPQTFSPEVQAKIARYIIELFTREDPAHTEISQQTTVKGLPQIDVRPDEGYFLLWLARLINAQKILEIGTLAGYSGIWLAKALPPDGKLTTLELDAKHAEVARRNFETLGVSEQVEIKVGNAHDTLKTLHDTFDMVFIDAEKEGYEAYLTWALEHVRVGGIIAAHNALKAGQVVDENNAEAQGIRAFNQRMATEPRLLSLLFPAGDGTVVGIVQG